MEENLPIRNWTFDAKKSSPVFVQSLLPLSLHAKRKIFRQGYKISIQRPIFSQFDAGTISRPVFLLWSAPSSSEEEEDDGLRVFWVVISWTGGGLTTVIPAATLSDIRPFISRCSWHKAHQCKQQCTRQGSQGESCNVEKLVLVDDEDDSDMFCQ